jgi:hypothetical protein
VKTETIYKNPPYVAGLFFLIVLYGNGTKLFWVSYLLVIPISCLFPDKVFDWLDQQGGEDDKSMHTEQGSTEGRIPLKHHPHCYGNSGQGVNKDCLVHPFSLGEEVVHFTIPSKRLTEAERFCSKRSRTSPAGVQPPEIR